MQKSSSCLLDETRANIMEQMEASEMQLPHDRIQNGEETFFSHYFKDRRQIIGTDYAYASKTRAVKTAHDFPKYHL